MTIPDAIPQVKPHAETAWLRGYMAGIQNAQGVQGSPWRQWVIRRIAETLAAAESANLLCTGCGRRFYSAADVASLNPELRNCECGAPLVGVNRG